MSESQKLYLRQVKLHKQKVRFVRFALLAAFLIFWELGGRLGYIDVFFFSGPSRVVKCFIDMTNDYVIFKHIGVTLFETIVSFFLVIVLSLIVSMLLWYFGTLSDVFEPFLVILNSLPKSALAPLFIVWFGSGIKTIVIAGMSVAIFGSIISLYTGFKQVDSEKIKLIHTLGGTKFDALFKVVVPSNFSTILSNMKVNIGLSLVGVVIGEFIGARSGLGYLIIYGSQVFKLDWIIMSILILCIIATGLYMLISKIEKMYLEKS